MAYLVCIDPGHAKNTAGKRSFDGNLREYEFNRDVAKRLKSHLERHGVKTMYSCNPESPVDASTYSRSKAANDAKADLFVSIHANAYGSVWNSANGWEIYYYRGSEGGKRFAECIHAESIPELGLRNRGVKANSTFVVICKTTMLAVLIEHGFYTNKTEVQKLLSDDFREKCAVADAKGILKYLGIAWKPPTSAPNTPKIVDVADFLVKVKADSLNIRKTPEIVENNVIGAITDKGTYTIVKTTADGTWGLLKAGPVKGSSWIRILPAYVDRK